MLLEFRMSLGVACRSRVSHGAKVKIFWVTSCCLNLWEQGRDGMWIWVRSTWLPDFQSQNRHPGFHPDIDPSSTHSRALIPTLEGGRSSFFDDVVHISGAYTAMPGHCCFIFSWPRPCLSSAVNL